ncbi:multidrug effflux MFS transporter [Aquirufa ecclesiirivi]|uniref:multidrug effflux MFS transporter n=1 Tax=Aquirufa ecclesiirivi TaxID=2715124 RepID=UPI001409CB77|nr:multidrug effflux MFS transporter [Aquirufa ecclesiirivi]MDF0692598.1 multidrug effflux MFS transporter [Aquirufa ecclesiirivi]NHC48030.1 multidrug effflux MFS transporter [Aquirufa ecclesiirivi]
MSKQSNRTKIILILGILSAIGPLSIDMYLPAFKNMAEALHCSQEQMGYTLSSFFFGICLGQLVNGPLLDHFGRKNVLYVGLSVYVISSFGSAFSTTVEQLIVWRFFQAIGGSIGMVAPNAVIRETFKESERPKILSLMMLILGVSPILAPSLGSLLLTITNWNVIFVLLGIITLVIIFLIRSWLPEKINKHPKGKFKMGSILTSYLALIPEKQFLTFAISGAIGSGCIFTFVSGAPLTFLNFYHADEKQFGWIFAMVASGIIGASQFNHWVLKRFSSQQVLSFVLPVQLVLGIVLALLSKFGLINIQINILLLFLILACQGLVFPNIISLALQPFHEGAGAASAMMGAMQMAWGSICATILGLLFDGTPFTMAIIMVFCALTANIILFVVGKKYFISEARINTDV